MEKIRRLTYNKEKENIDIEYFGFNSRGTFTIKLKDDTIINLNKDEFHKLKEFINQLE